MSFALCNIRTRIGKNPVNLVIEPGERIVIAGPSGAGKTTLARVMVGLDAPLSGLILWNGLQCKNLPELWGIEFQGGALFTGMTVKENIVFSLKYSMECTDSFLHDVALFYLRSLGLEDSLLNRYPHQLSGGQKKLVALARALAKQPKLLLLDEPTAGLDPASASLFHTVLCKFCENSKISVVIISHNLEEIKSAKRVIFIKNGRFELVEPSDIDISWWEKNINIPTRSRINS